ncbi:spore protease YyaC [Salipaludibacillus sp. CUR1]|uniref:spore protease YyaC n=1 Tax=Salipaludibacillus sp. CUR1 TaxID=2820003 RepID=UPI001E58E71B|nr:spore protease YyaC [Salipaludibacillus sp. CUR1]MCE7790982.1 spore protease YyaC [Salipaludibacillus sp. CUR1]
MMVYGQLFREKNNKSERFHMEDPLAVQKLSRIIFSCLPSSPDVPVVVVCIGSDRSTGDSLGPLIGSKLLEKRCPLFSVYGTLDSTVHAKNLENTLDYIHKNYTDPFIIALDACLGRTESVGFMTISEGPVIPGAAVKKKLPPVGDIHMTGIVNVGGYMEMMVLQNTRLSLVMSMADSMAESLWKAGCWQSNRHQILYPKKEGTV